MGEDFKGVYWEKLSQKMVDGQLVLSGRGVFADINKVKMVSKQADMGMGDEEGEGKPAEKEQLSFKFEQGADGGKLTLVMDSGQQGMGGPGMGGEGEGEAKPAGGKMPGLLSDSDSDEDIDGKTPGGATRR